jgi:hypothetical protein
MSSYLHGVGALVEVASEGSCESIENARVRSHLRSFSRRLLTRKGSFGEPLSLQQAPARLIQGAMRSILAPRVFSLTLASLLSCVPTGSAPPWDGGTRTIAKPVVQAPDVLTQVFEDNFDDRPSDAGFASVVVAADAGLRLIEIRAGDGGANASDASALVRSDAGLLVRPDSSSPFVPGLPPLVPGAPTSALSASTGVAPSAMPEPLSNLGPNWRQAAKANAWRVENGKLCAKGAKNQGVWLTKKIPVNARIEYDAIATTAQGDLKAEIWGDGQSSATSVSYTNATSYLAVLGGWQNTFHVLARVNEHGKDRKEIKVDKDSDDAREHPVSVGQVYRVRVERTDGKTVRVSVNNIEYFTWVDAEPLAGLGHDHFGFNNWEVKTCFDNVKVTPL